MRARVRIGIAVVVFAPLLMSCGISTNGEQHAGAVRQGASDPAHGTGSGKRSQLPKGEKYVVASGVFGQQWGEHSGKQWRLVAWGDKTGFCWRLVVGQGKTRQGMVCSHFTRPPRDEHILGRIFAPVESKTRALSYGTVSKAVARLEYYLSSGEQVIGEVIEAPSGLRAPVNFFFHRVPMADDGEILAYDRKGTLLEHKRLVGGP